jgi:D-alanyl-lipoteichoic acid acyltransferase DltB (MBOAT superfamily)
MWGFFKKIVIADNCATYVNTIFDNYADQPASALVIGALFFAFQIYGDFSGYSDIALGTSGCWVLNCLEILPIPYFSRDIAEFWRRWHISLIKLVQGLLVHTSWRQQRRILAQYQEHIHNFPGKWLLARSELDISLHGEH